MTSPARIHIDDLVLGRGPSICAVTGEPTSDRVEVSSGEGGVQGWWWLLVLLGPVGWVGLAILVSIARRQNRVSGVLPVQHEALDRYEAVLRFARAATALAFAVVVAAAAAVVLAGGGSGLGTTMVALAGGAVLLAVAVGAWLLAPYRWIDLRLDGSGRWVTVVRAHPAYAEALRAHYEAAGAPRS